MSKTPKQEALEALYMLLQHVEGIKEYPVWYETVRDYIIQTEE